MIIDQVVQVQIGGAPRTYTYSWQFDPAIGGLPLAVGQRVEIPANIVQEDGGSAVVVKLGSTYAGPMKAIVRVIDGPPKESPDDQLWGGFEEYE
ncbi:hypothetical protein ACFWPU_00690 [Streptomyces sp. NPDC058471]|uniref:hypothetical protein n=1 Tax=Streptomyces sp. NPDC058471 TaxID=3346516 RepID=UPI00365AA047